MQGLLFFITSFFPFFCLYGQHSPVSAQVFDSAIQNFVPYATIELRNLKTGTVGNAEGYFSIEVPNDHFLDSLLVRSLGYYDTIVSIQQLLAMDTPRIAVRPRVYDLANVEVKPQKESVFLGVEAASANTGYALARWMQVAVYMKNENRYSGVLKTVSFFIGKNPKPRTPFRVRIYAVDEDGSPGEDLLQESVIVAGKREGEWLEVNLLDHKVIFPESGLFVAMEWILSDQRHYYTVKIGDRKLQFYGQELGNALNAVQEQKTWIYQIGGDWQLDDKIFEVGRKRYGRNALIRCEIQLTE